MAGPGHDPVHVLIIDDDPDDVLMVYKSFAQVGGDRCLHLVPGGQRALRFLRRAGDWTTLMRPVPGSSCST